MTTSRRSFLSRLPLGLLVAPWAAKRLVAKQLAPYQVLTYEGCQIIGTDLRLARFWGCHQDRSLSLDQPGSPYLFQIEDDGVEGRFQRCTFPIKAAVVPTTQHPWGYWETKLVKAEGWVDWSHWPMRPHRAVWRILA